MPDDSRYKPFPMRQQLLATGISVAVALLVMWWRRDLVWTFVTFFVLSIIINGIMLWVRDHKR